MSNLSPQKIILDITASVLLGLGTIGILSPFLMYWFIHGNYDRYIWIIHGPYPFSSFGGGPFQLFMDVGLMLAGAILIIISLILKGTIWKELTSSASNPYFKIVRWLVIIAIIGIFSLILLLWISSWMSQAHQL